MKLRIKGNSLRVRLTQGEVVALAEKGLCRETMALVTGRLSYEVRVSDDIEQPQAIFEQSDIVVTLPAGAVEEWAQSDEVTIAGEHGPLRILVEKDFACLAPREGEDESDMFPHPEAGARADD